MLFQCVVSTLNGLVVGAHKGGLKRTLGVEWEFSPARFDLDSANMDPMIKMSRMTNAYNSELAGSNFRRLFAFYGKNSRGEWVENLIPPKIVHSKKFHELKNTAGIQFDIRDGQTYLANYQNLNQEQFISVLRRLMEARGKTSDELSLRKIQRAWSDKANRFDQMISDQVSEEWRDGNRFTGIEFSMNGAVRSGADIRGYIKNLWTRLGLFDANDSRLEQALDQAVGHVHWVPDIQSLPAPQRQKVYEAVIGYWGDVNDSNEIKRLNMFQSAARLDGSVSLGKDQVENLWWSLRESYGQYSITTLTSETYGRLAATPDGVLVHNRATDLDLAVDSNLPPVFKRLQFGLRGIYGQSSVENGKAIPIIGIEARDMPTVAENLNALPAKVKGKPEVDLLELLEHSSKGVRGLECSPVSLKARAMWLGIDASIVDDLSRVIEKDSYKWPSNQVLARFLLPLNDWLAHPTVTRNLAKMTLVEKEAAISRYHHAIQKYRDRINQLAKARKNPTFRYQPDWTEPLKEFPDGINRVYSRNEFPEVAEIGELNSRPDMWFQMILSSEASRFITEANLEKLMTIRPANP
jgi:hypothetical protein